MAIRGLSDQLEMKNFKGSGARERGCWQAARSVVSSVSSMILRMHPDDKAPQAELYDGYSSVGRREGSKPADAAGIECCLPAGMD